MSDEFAEVERDTTDAFEREIVAGLDGCPIPRYGLCVITHTMKLQWIYRPQSGFPVAMLRWRRRFFAS
jgi:hypothetical protein